MKPPVRYVASERHGSCRSSGHRGGGGGGSVDAVAAVRVRRCHGAWYPCQRSCAPMCTVDSTSAVGRALGCSRARQLGGYKVKQGQHTRRIRRTKFEYRRVYVHVHVCISLPRIDGLKHYQFVCTHTSHTTTACCSDVSSIVTSPFPTFTPATGPSLVRATSRQSA